MFYAVECSYAVAMGFWVVIISLYDVTLVPPSKSTAHMLYFHLFYHLLLGENNFGVAKKNNFTSTSSCTIGGMIHVCSKRKA